MRIQEETSDLNLIKLTVEIFVDAIEDDGFVVLNGRVLLKRTDHGYFMASKRQFFCQRISQLVVAVSMRMENCQNFRTTSTTERTYEEN